jgi:aspartyl-tRNA(Asn)/glutamyl-tRNA(Gln) amidotransferase subunit C
MQVKCCVARVFSGQQGQNVLIFRLVFLLYAVTYLPGVFMSIEVDEVKKIARLACLNVDDADIQSYATNLSNILDLVAQMDAVDTTGVTPMSHPFDAVQRLREDVVTEPNRREEFQAIAPKTKDGLYLVPKVIE